MNKALTLILLTIMAIGIATLTLAEDASEGYLQGGMTDNVTRVNGNPETIVATGGNITQTNFTIEQQTSFWAGFYGNVTQFPVLEGGTNNFYTWTGGISFTQGFVIFVNESTVDWGAVTFTSFVQREAEDTALGLTGEVDSVNNTFTLTNTAAINISGTIIAAGSAASVNTSGGTEWETVMVRETTSDLVLYTAVLNPGNTNYAGVTSDYQAMIPTDGTQRTYYVYVGLA